MGTYRYRRLNDPEPVEVVAASYDVTPSGVAVFHDVTEENGAPLRRVVDVRRVRISGQVDCRNVGEWSVRAMRTRVATLASLT